MLAAARFAGEGRVVASELPGGEVATAVHRGDYARLGATHDAVREFAVAHGRELAGPRWEIYGHWREDPSELETEIFWLAALTWLRRARRARRRTGRRFARVAGSQATSTDFPEAATVPSRSTIWWSIWMLEVPTCARRMTTSTSPWSLRTSA